MSELDPTSDPWVAGHVAEIDAKLQVHLDKFKGDLDFIFDHANRELDALLFSEEEREQRAFGLPKKYEEHIGFICRLLDRIPEGVGFVPEITVLPSVAGELQKTYERRARYWANAAGVDADQLKNDSQPFLSDEEMAFFRDREFSVGDSKDYSDRELLAWLTTKRDFAAREPNRFQAWTTVTDGDITTAKAAWTVGNVIAHSEEHITEPYDRIRALMITGATSFNKGDGLPQSMAFVIHADVHTDYLVDPLERASANFMIAKAFGEAWGWNSMQVMQKASDAA